jgi:hypothetical protein
MIWFALGIAVAVFMTGFYDAAIITCCLILISEGFDSMMEAGNRDDK